MVQVDLAKLFESFVFDWISKILQHLLNKEDAIVKVVHKDLDQLLGPYSLVFVELTLFKGLRETVLLVHVIVYHGSKNLVNDIYHVLSADLLKLRNVRHVFLLLTLG